MNISSLRLSKSPTRAENWHDFFGALIWCLFPKTKALLNQLHMAEIAEHGQQQRSKLRNKLTLLDECGVLVCLEPEQLAHAELLRQHQWQQSFVTKRSDWWQAYGLLFLVMLFMKWPPCLLLA
ncbi:hypothetical protein ALON55S_02729 [Alishewanella longhuensis]